MGYHTKGPWEIEGTKVHGNDFYHSCVATYHPFDENTKLNREDVENLQLIASAPELLLALESLMKSIRNIKGGLGKEIEEEYCDKQFKFAIQTIEKIRKDNRGSWSTKG